MEIKQIFKSGSSSSLFSLDTYLCSIQLHLTPQLLCLSKNILAVIDFLRSHSILQYSSLLDIAVTDTPSARFRYSTAYILRSYESNKLCILRLKTNQVSPIKSVTSIHNGAN